MCIAHIRRRCLSHAVAEEHANMHACSSNLQELRNLCVQLYHSHMTLNGYSVSLSLLQFHLEILKNFAQIYSFFRSGIPLQKLYMSQTCCHFCCSIKTENRWSTDTHTHTLIYLYTYVF